MPNPISKLLSLGDGKRLRRYRRTVDEINALEGGLSALTDAELRAAADRLRERAAAGEPNEGLLPESFALVREASKRTVGLRRYDVQLIGGMALNDGCVAEMRTGEEYKEEAYRAFSRLVDSIYEDSLAPSCACPSRAQALPLVGFPRRITPSAPRAWCTPTPGRPPRPRRSRRPTPQGEIRSGNCLRAVA